MRRTEMDTASTCAATSQPTNTPSLEKDFQIIFEELACWEEAGSVLSGWACTGRQKEKWQSNKFSPKTRIKPI
jgi:hypothetical protein